MNLHANPAHVIRLNAAWERIEFANDRSMVHSSKVSLPDATPFSRDTTCIHYERKFNSPTGLTATDALILESELLRIAEQVTLNDAALLVTETQTTADITTLLRGFNHLKVVMSVSDAEQARSATARLLIYAG